MNACDVFDKYILTSRSATRKDIKEDKLMELHMVSHNNNTECASHINMFLKVQGTFKALSNLGDYRSNDSNILIILEDLHTLAGTLICINDDSNTHSLLTCKKLTNIADLRKDYLLTHTKDIKVNHTKALCLHLDIKSPRKGFNRVFSSRTNYFDCAK